MPQFDAPVRFCMSCGEPVPNDNDCGALLMVLGQVLGSLELMQMGLQHPPKHLLPTATCRGVNTWAQYLPGWPTERGHTKNYTQEKKVLVRRAYRMLCVLAAGNLSSPNTLVETPTLASKVTLVTTAALYGRANLYAQDAPFPVLLGLVARVAPGQPELCALEVPNDEYVIEQASFCLAGFWHVHSGANR